MPDPTKRRVRGRPGAVLLTAMLALRPDVTAAQSAGVCDGQDPWVAGLAERSLTYGDMGRFAVAWQGDPVACEGRVETEFDGGSFGSVEVRFANGMVFAVRTFPPEGSVTRLALPSGFDDPDPVIAVLREHAERFGLRVDWSAPELIHDRGRTVTTYWDPDPGINGSVALVRDGERLVEVRISAAL